MSGEYPKQRKERQRKASQAEKAKARPDVVVVAPVKPKTETKPIKTKD